MAKRPFIVSDDERAENIIAPSAQELEDDTPRLMRKFAKKYGDKYPRLLASLRATEVKPDDNL